MPLKQAPGPDAAMELRNIRTFLGWTQTRLADALGTSAGAMSYWEKGTKPVPVPVLRLARYLALSLPPPSVFRAAPPDTSQEVRVRAGARCYWYQNDELPCRGRRYHVFAQLSRRRHLVSEVCEGHLHTAFACIYFRLDTATKDEARRQAGRRRKRLERLRAREGVADAVR